MNEIFGLDAYSPPQIAVKVRDLGVGKTSLPLLTLSMLGVLAGAFILVWLSGHASLNDGAVGRTVVQTVSAGARGCCRSSARRS